MGFRNMRLRDERGIALVLVLMILLVATALAAVAAAGAIRSNHQSFRDRNSKRAFQAAVAGVQSGNYQATLMQPPPTRCVVDTSGTLTVADSPGAWCPPQTKGVGDGATYTQYVSEGTPYDDPITGQHLVDREIVSTGSVNGVTRRVSVKVNAVSAAPLFPTGFSVVSLDPVNWGNGVRAFGNVGSNGNIKLVNDAQIHGNAITLSPSTTTTAQTAVVTGSRIQTSTPFAVNPVNPEPQDSNIRITNRGQSGADTCTNCNGVSWNEGTRVLALSGSAVLTLGGHIYNFCKLTLRNSAKLRVATSVAVKVYMDSPENCPAAGSGAGSVTLANASNLENGNPNPSAFQIYMVGSPSVPTTLDAANAAGSQLILAVYAPYSSVHLHNGVHFTGALAAQSIPIDNGATITYDSRIGGIVGGGIPVYRATRSWRECTAKPSGAAVNSGCWDD
jgi:Tfp pilus assembly protein PilX